MPRGLPISTFVDISTAIAAGGVLRTQFGTGLLISTDASIAAGGTGKAQVFSDIDAVNAVFDAGEALDGAAVWFSADPPPKSLYIGRWATTDVATTLRGGSPAVIGDISIANATFSVAGNNVTANLSGASTYTAAATTLQSLIRTAGGGEVTGVTVGAGGSSYAQTTTTVAFSGGGATLQATGTVTVTSGAVTAVTVSTPGRGYSSIPTVTITDSGSGTGATATAAISTGDLRLSGATFVYDTNSFLLTLTGADDIGATFGSTGTGTDISTLLGFGVSSGANYQQGHDAEGVVDAIGEMIALATGTAPVALMLANDAPLTSGGVDTRNAVAAYAQAGDFVFGLLDTSDQALVTGDTSSHAAQAFENEQSHVEPLYSAPGQRPDIGLLALLSSQNLNQPGSIITPHLKSLPGARPTRITETQRRELERKRTNVYTTVGGSPALVGGYTGRAGSWADAVWFLLFLKNELELSIFNAQRASRRFNTAILTDTVTGVMEVAVRSGGVMPGGQVNSSTKQEIISVTGNNDFDGTLVAGYLLWVEQPSARSDLDREARVGRFRAWLSPSDAIHSVIGDLILSG